MYRVGYFNPPVHMAQQLLSSFGKRGVDHGLFTMKVDIEDTAFLSKYFDVAEFNPVFTAGKNSIAFNGSKLLKDGAEIQVQCQDSNGNNLYLDYPRSSTQYVDVAKFVVAIHVYNETYNGAGKIALVGTTAKNEIVRWIGNISIDKTLQNVSKTRFQATPTLEARSLLYNVISNDIASQLTSVINFTGSCYGNALAPQKDTVKSLINPKKTDTDYRLTFNPKNPKTIGPVTYPTASFNTQMEGQPITLVTDIIQEPFSYRERRTRVTASFKVKKVLNSTTLLVDNPFFYPVGKDQVVTNINVAYFTASYKWVAYNTMSDAYNKYTDSGGNVTYQKESYVELLYRNLATFTGFIARHKVYRKSMLYPGDFQLLTDESIGTRDLLTDPVTANKSYNLMGNFYNQFHINRYWFTSSNKIGLSHSVAPRINSMKIDKSGSNYSVMNGHRYVIVKMDAASGSVNDHVYYPYDKEAFDELSGSSYYSNFIDLKSGSLYVLSTNLMVEKDVLQTGAKIEFYFTSSIPDITKEKYYIPPYGWKLGEITIPDQTDLKIFSSKQYIYFTPYYDYYGTIVIVPYSCCPTFNELSVGVYGDYGFSPESATSKVPFKINVANEPWTIKSELYDINSTLVYSNLQTVQTFDVDGQSLFVFYGNAPLDPAYTSFVSGNLTISKSLYVQHLNAGPQGNPLVAWIRPTHNPPQLGEGAIVYTDILGATIMPSHGTTTKDYVSITTTSGEGRAIAVHYSGSLSQGRRIVVDKDGTKHTYS